MSKRTKRNLMIAASFVLVGCIVLGGVMTMLQWDFAKLSTVEYETNTYEITENFKHISIVGNTADIRFEPCENTNGSVVCYEQKRLNHAVAVKDGTLVIEVVDTRKWYEHIGIHFGAPKITVRIPQGDYGALVVNSDTGNVEIPKDFTFESMDISQSTGDVANAASVTDVVKIKTSTGKICVENISVGALDLSVSTGSVTVSDVVCSGDVRVNVSTGKTTATAVTCQNLLSRGSTGSIALNNVIAADAFSIERSTGHVIFDGCDAAEIFVKTDTGAVTGTLCSDKVFMTKTDTGRVEVPRMVTGGVCEVITSTGDIKLDIV